jgi:hypothetical protein
MTLEDAGDGGRCLRRWKMLEDADAVGTTLINTCDTGDGGIFWCGRCW